MLKKERAYSILIICFVILFIMYMVGVLMSGNLYAAFVILAVVYVVLISFGKKKKLISFTSLFKKREKTKGKEKRNRTREKADTKVKLKFRNVFGRIVYDTNKLLVVGKEIYHIKSMDNGIATEFLNNRTMKFSKQEVLEFNKNFKKLCIESGLLYDNLVMEEVEALYKKIA